MGNLNSFNRNVEALKIHCVLRGKNDKRSLSNKHSLGKNSQNLINVALRLFDSLE